MANTYLLAGALTGMHVTVACPVGYEPDADRRRAGGGTREQFGTGAEARGRRATRARRVAGADVVVTDTWASMGQEAEHAARVSAFAGYTVDDAN